MCLRAKSLQSYLTLSTPVDCRPPGSSLCGISQARMEWVSVSTSRGSSQARDRTLISNISYLGRQVLYHESHLGSPPEYVNSIYNQLRYLSLMLLSYIPTSSHSSWINPAAKWSASKSQIIFIPLQFSALLKCYWLKQGHWLRLVSPGSVLFDSTHGKPLAVLCCAYLLSHVQLFASPGIKNSPDLSFRIIT